MTDTIEDVAAAQEEPAVPALDEQGIVEQLVAQAREKGIELVGPNIQADRAAQRDSEGVELALPGLAKVELLDTGQIRELILAATGPFLGGMWSPLDAHASRTPARRIGQHGRSASARRLRTASRPRGSVRDRSRRGCRDHRWDRRGRRAVVAAGVWTPYLAHTAGVEIPIMPVVMSELETEPVAPLFTATLRAFGFGAMPSDSCQARMKAVLQSA